MISFVTMAFRTPVNTSPSSVYRMSPSHSILSSAWKGITQGHSGKTNSMLELWKMSTPERIEITLRAHQQCTGGCLPPGCQLYSQPKCSAVLNGQNYRAPLAQTPPCPFPLGITEVLSTIGDFSLEQSSNFRSRFQSSVFQYTCS